MARYTGPVCRLCRRDGLKLFLKGTRCATRRNAHSSARSPAGHARPGARGRKARRLRCSPPREAKSEALLRRFGAAVPQVFPPCVEEQGKHGATLLTLLECRFDNVVHRLGFGQSREPGSADCVARAHHGERPSRRRFQLPGSRRRRDPRQEPGQEPRFGAGRVGRVAPRRARFPVAQRLSQFPKAWSAGCPRPMKYPFRSRPS